MSDTYEQDDRGRYEQLCDGSPATRERIAQLRDLAVRLSVRLPATAGVKRRDEATELCAAIADALDRAGPKRIDALPAELLDKIARYLPSSEVARLARSSQRLNQAIDSARTRQRSFGGGPSPLAFDLVRRSDAPPPLPPFDSDDDENNEDADDHTDAMIERVDEFDWLDDGRGPASVLARMARTSAAWRDLARTDRLRRVRNAVEENPRTKWTAVMVWLAERGWTAPSNRRFYWEQTVALHDDEDWPGAPWPNNLAMLERESPVARVGARSVSEAFDGERRFVVALLSSLMRRSMWVERVTPALSAVSAATLGKALGYRGPSGGAFYIHGNAPQAYEEQVKLSASWPWARVRAVPRRMLAELAALPVSTADADEWRAAWVDFNRAMYEEVAEVGPETHGPHNEDGSLRETTGKVDDVLADVERAVPGALATVVDRVAMPPYGSLVE